MRPGVPVLASLIIGVAVGLSATPGGTQELQFLCDANRDDTVSAEEGQSCTERRVERARAGADGLAAEQFAAARPDADGLRRQFAQADENGDGRISRDEWMRWFGPAHGATDGTVGRHSGSD